MMNLMIGLISGTSMDGIDAVLVNMDTQTLLDGYTHPYSLEIRARLECPITSLKDYSHLNTLLGREFAKAVSNLLQRNQLASSAIKAIGSHGQTMCHNPQDTIPYTIQLGCAHTIAEYTKITVVADFRTRDIVAGGQGAPFAPLFHQALAHNLTGPLAFVNIGGIANISIVNNEDLIGYDTGPGNCLLDAWINQHLQVPYDKSGEWAAKGQVIESLLTDLLNDPYFSEAYPKSIGKEYFSLEWLHHHGVQAFKAEDVQATLLRLTACSIAAHIQKHALKLTQVLICGGGVHNQRLMQELIALLPLCQVRSSAEIGIHPDYIEAHMFAWLAEKTLNMKAVSLKSITGSPHPLILGVIYPAGIDKGISLEV